MARYITRDATHPTIRAAVTEALRNIPPDPRAEAAAIFDWIKAHVSFREDAEPARPLAGLIDPATTEVLIRPADLLNMPHPAGDCDDHAMLASTMLLSRGIEPELLTIAADPATPDLYSHVYARARLAAGPFALDTSHGPRPGWEAPTAGKTRTWRLQEMRTLGAINWEAILPQVIKAGTDIATARYGQPPEGTYKQEGPAGSVYYRQPQNAGPLQFPGLQATGGYTWILVGLGVFALVMVMSKGNR
jgi:hypothetical protein